MRFIIVIVDFLRLRARMSIFTSLLHMSTHLATFSEILQKSYIVTKKRIWVFVLGMLLIGVTWILPQVLSSVFFSLMNIPSAGHLSVIFWILGFFFTVLAYAVQLLASAYPIVIILESKSGVIASFKKSITFIVRFFLASIWIGLRSFVWVAFIGGLLVGMSTLFKGQQLGLLFVALGLLLILAGVIIGLILMPRFAFSMVILVKENCSSRACVRESYKRTYGYWGKIVGNFLLYSLVCSGAVLGIALLFGILGVTAVVLRSFGYQLLSMIIMIPAGIVFVLAFIAFVVFLTLFGAVFNVALYETIYAHPIHRKIQKA